MNEIRVQKHLSQMGVLSRRKAEQAILDGRVRKNGKQVVLGDKLNPQDDHLTLDGKSLGGKPPLVYWLLHKPDKTLVSRQSQHDMPTIYQLGKLAAVPFPVNGVGRLDYRTEGLLLMTNDGELSHRLCHPKYKLPRRYWAVVKGKLSQEQLAHIKKEGVKLNDGVASPEIVSLGGKNLGKTKGSQYFVTVQEGRNRLVRRIFEHFSMEVVRLVRFGFGEIRLEEDLKPGDYRQLTSKEIQYLKSSVELL